MIGRRSFQFSSVLIALAAACTSLAMDPRPALAASAGALAEAAPGLAGAACPAILQRTALRLQDEKPQDLCQYKGQVVLVVNTASFCGFTPQYRSLEALYARYKSRGFVVLGFPSNDFSQEPGSNKEIADFCENTFSVKFPMFTKTRVAAGGQTDPLFVELARETGQAPSWNFHKYLISRDGRTVISRPSKLDPASAEFTKEIERMLAASS